MTGLPYITRAEEFVTDVAIATHRLKRYPIGTLLVAMYGEGKTRGQVSELGIEATINQACAAISVDPRKATTAFVRLALEANYRQMRNLAEGGNQPNLNLSKLKEFPVSLPPLAEQKRIADKLDALLARVDACRERLERVSTVFKRFRQAVLKAATTGELTRDWRDSSQALSWQPIVLKDVCSSIADGDHQAPPQSDSGVPFVTISAIHDGELNLSRATRSVPQSYYDGLSESRRARRNDVLFSVTGSIGLTAIVQTDAPFVFQRHIAILRANNAKIRHRFLSYRLRAFDIQEQGRNVATGTAQLTIPLNGLRAFRFALPTLEEQDEIVRRLDLVFDLLNQIELRFRSVQEMVDRLTPSLLAKAFRGELVPQDPHDEPASELLARVRAAATVSTTATTGKAKRRAETPSNPRAAPTTAASGAAQPAARVPVRA
jgi:type I restriction enzyme S subunit